MALIDDILRIAIAAGEDILEVYASDFDVAVKPDASPVTEADTRAEKIIIDGLRAIAPAIPIIAEESVAAGIVPPPSEEFFLVDPLDGSKEFISRNGEFTVNIALVRNGAPVLGVVHAPALGRIWWGAADGGAFAGQVKAGVLDGIGTVTCMPCHDARYRVVASRSHPDAGLKAWLETVEVADLVAAGSSLKFCLLAEGRADIYPRFGRTMEWDTAAGHAVLLAAGGVVLTLEDAPLTYGKRGLPGDSDFANPHFIARAHR